ncbi:MAG: hypothetical protein WBA63_06145 [Thermomicrobiales bacterium]
MYASTATMMVAIPASDALDGYNANLLAQNLSTTYQALIASEPVLQPVALAADPPMTVANLRENLTVAASTGTLLDITVTDGDPARAAALVNGVVDSFEEFVGRLSAGDAAEIVGHPLSISPGTVATDPFAPNLPAYVALGLIGGLVLASASIFLIESLDSRVRSTSDFQSLVGAPLLASLPSLGRRRQGKAVRFLDDTRAVRASESIRVLRNAVVSVGRVPGSLLVVASPNKDDGKTLVAVNLAEAAARSGKRVLLVDANLRNPELHKIFHLDNVHGLGALIASPELASNTAAIQVAPNLSVMPSGIVRAHPGDLFMSTAFGDLLSQLLTTSDMVIVDTPAVSEANDAVAIATHTGNVVLVCRIGKDRLPRIQDVCRRFGETGAPTLGVVTNGGGRMVPRLHPPRSWARRRYGSPWQVPSYASTLADQRSPSRPSNDVAHDAKTHRRSRS